MGMYDTLSFTCPVCNSQTSMQSKMGECVLATYTLNDAPLLVIADIHDEGLKNRLFCTQCNKALQIEVRFVASVSAKASGDETDMLRRV